MIALIAPRSDIVAPIPTSSRHERMGTTRHIRTPSVALVAGSPVSRTAVMSAAGLTTKILIEKTSKAVTEFMDQEQNKL
jgi:glutamine phosphoribosylpyrophosphate amidotransferase